MDASDYLSLSAAAKQAPGRPSANCIWRWCRKGVLARNGKRVRLRHIRTGGKIYTTARWLQAFGEKLAQADAEHFDLDARPAVPRKSNRRRTDRRRQMAIERAERQLRRAGV